MVLNGLLIKLREVTMSKILCFLALIVWLIVTFLLAISIVGLFFLLADYTSWLCIAEDLVKGIKGGNQ